MSFRLSLATLFTLAMLAPAQDKVRVYFGTYTGKDSKGIYQSELDLKDGSLTEPMLAAESSSPSFLAIHPNKKFLYAVNENKVAVSAFAIDPKTGALTYLNSEPTKGAGPCHVTVDPSGKNVLAANYGGGSCISIPIDADGKLTSNSSFQQHQGAKKNGHSIHVDKAGKFALCCDLGLNKVIVYAFDAAKGTLTPHSEFEAPAGSGPRHFAWHPDGKTAYINGEMGMNVIVCDYDAEKGTLKQKQTLSTLPKDVMKKGGSTAETVVHPSGKFVYVSNRDPYNSIAIFKVDPKTHELTPVGHQAEGIKTPRNFAIEPTGQYMLVANQSLGNVLVFKINQETGELTPTGKSVKVGAPVCVRFLEMK